MKTKVAPIVIALMFFGALISSDLKLVKGRTAPKDKRIRLSKYGVVLTTPTANNKGARDLHHEGYAIAYRAKNPRTGKEEDRLAYAFGARQVSNLKPVKQKAGQTIVRTRDGELEITSEVKWDHTLNELRTWRSFKVTGTTEVVVLAIESYIDNLHKGDFAQVAFTAGMIEAALATGPIAIFSGQICECPVCPIQPCPDPGPDPDPGPGNRGYQLKSGRYRALLNPLGPALIASDPVVSEILKSNPVNVVSWKAGENMPSETIARGKNFSAFRGQKFE